MKLFPIVRLRQFLSNPLFVFFWFARLFYKRRSFIYVDKYKKINQLSNNETLEYIIKNKKSIIRFGDGEFGLLLGAGIFCKQVSMFRFDWHQEYSKELKRETERLLSLRNQNILLAIPPIEHITHNDRFGSLFSYQEKIYSAMYTEARMFLWKYVDYGKVYGSWSVFMKQHNPNFNWNLFFSFIKSKNVVIITGNICALINIKLGKKTFFIETGKYNAFEKRDKITKDIDTFLMQNNMNLENSIFFVSLGPTAGIIVEHISNKGLMAWDTGHMFTYAYKELESKNQY